MPAVRQGGGAGLIGRVDRERQGQKQGQDAICLSSTLRFRAGPDAGCVRERSDNPRRHTSRSDELLRMHSLTHSVRTCAGCHNCSHAACHVFSCRIRTVLQRERGIAHEIDHPEQLRNNDQELRRGRRSPVFRSGFENPRFSTPTSGHSEAMVIFLAVLFSPVLGSLIYLGNLGSLICLGWLLRSGSRRAFFAALAITTITLGLLAWTCWELRDGFTDEVSSGTEAWHNFWNDFWLPTIVWCVFVAATFGIYHFKRHRALQSNNTFKRNPHQGDATV
jgi:hypothetical protein